MREQRAQRCQPRSLLCLVHTGPSLLFLLGQHGRNRFSRCPVGGALDLLGYRALQPAVDRIALGRYHRGFLRRLFGGFLRRRRVLPHDRVRDDCRVCLRCVWKRRGGDVGRLHDGFVAQLRQELAEAGVAQVEVRSEPDAAEPENQQSGSGAAHDHDGLVRLPARGLPLAGGDQAAGGGGRRLKGPRTQRHAVLLRAGAAREGRHGHFAGLEPVIVRQAAGFGLQRRLQRHAHVGRAVIPSLGFLGEHLEDHRLEPRVLDKGRGVERDGRRLADAVLKRQPRGVQIGRQAVEHRLAGQRLIQAKAQGVQVRLRRAAVAAGVGELRRHVVQRAGNAADGHRAAHVARHAEIEDLALLGLAHRRIEVAWLDVAVDDRARAPVQELERREVTAEKRDRLRDFQPALVLQAGPQGPARHALQKLHHQKELLLAGCAVKDHEIDIFDEVRVRILLKDLGLFDEAVRLLFGEKVLHRDQHAVTHAASLKDLAEAAAPQNGEQLVLVLVLVADAAVTDFAELLQHGREGREALLAPGREALRHQRLGVAQHAEHAGTERGRRGSLVAPAVEVADMRGLAQRLIRQRTRQRLIKTDPQTEDVRQLVAAEAVDGDEVRRHVVEGALPARRAHLPAVIAARDVEIDQLGLAFLGDENIRRLEVAVRDAALARMDEARQALLEHLLHLGPRQPGIGVLEAVAERLALQQFHHQALRLVPLAGMPGEAVAVAHNARVRQAPQDLGLLLKLVAELLVLARDAYDL